MTTANELRIRAADLTDEHVGMDIMSGAGWLSRRRLDVLEHCGQHIVVGTLAYDLIKVNPGAELVLTAPFIRTDRDKELADMVEWFLRAYHFSDPSIDHLHIAVGIATAFARQALDTGRGGDVCQRVIDLQIGPRNPFLACAQTGAVIPELIVEAGLELDVRRLLKLNNGPLGCYPWPDTTKLHYGIIRSDRGAAAVYNDLIQNPRAFAETRIIATRATA